MNNVTKVNELLKNMLLSSRQIEKLQNDIAKIQKEIDIIYSEYLEDLKAFDELRKD